MARPLRVCCSSSALRFSAAWFAAPLLTALGASQSAAAAAATAQHTACFATQAQQQVALTDSHASSLQATRAAAAAGFSSTFAQLGLAASRAAGWSFRVKVTTGRRRGAGTADPVALQLVGAHGTSDKFWLDTGDRGFERGSEERFTITVPQNLGPLRRVHVEKQDSVSEPGRGWYLRHIEVESSTGEKVLFPCNAWLGDSDSGDYTGPTERNLLPAATEMLMGHHEPVTVSAAGLAIPHPDKVVRQKLKGVNRRGSGHAGEDSYFYCEGRNQLFGMGVADGVYSWREAGIDSGVMSQTLMRHSRLLIEGGTEDVFKVLQSSSRYVVNQGLQGSCTACLLTVNQASGQLHAANLGDSGFLVLGKPHPQRGHLTNPQLEVKYRTNQLEHEFGRPYQIGHHEHASRAEDADLVSFFVCPGDVIVMGSDGLLDNVSDDEIATMLTQLLAEGAGPGRMVQTLVKAAFEASVDKHRITPYAREASDAFSMVYSGGKKDDITVLVAQCK